MPLDKCVKESLKMEISNNFREKPVEIKNIWYYIGIPAAAFAFAEILIFWGMKIEALGMHAVILLGLSFSMMFVKNTEIQKTYLALILLPILRLVNLSMPIYYEKTLYSFIFTYGILAIPVSIAATNQEFTRTQLGMTFKKIWFYAPISILLGLLLGGGEYLIIKTNYLISDLSTFNLLMLSIVMIFFVGLVEEIIFRSILQNRLQIALGNRSGLIITSILFGLMHTGYGSVGEVLYASVVGIFVGYLFYKTRSLPLVAMIHGFINVFVFGIIPLIL